MAVSVMYAADEIG